MEIISHNIENKKGIAKAIAVLFDDKNGIPGYIREIALVRLIWAATENKDDGKWKKYEGQPFWSELALKKMINNRKERLNPFKGLRHEHSVPKKVIKLRIYNSDKTELAIFKILNELAHAVVITKEEDDILNNRGFRTTMAKDLLDNNNSENVFSRYNEVGIKILIVPDISLSKLTKGQVAQFPEVVNTALAV